LEFQDDPPKWACVSVTGGPCSSKEIRVLIQKVALIMDVIDEDPELTRLSDEEGSSKATSFRQRVRHIRTLALQGDESAVLNELEDLLGQCRGPLDRWREEVTRALADLR
jgi:hypothetical protein